jgi:hypothetical protein
LFLHLQAKKTEIELLQQNSKRYWILMCIKNETQEKKTTSFTALVITARDDKNEALLFIQQCVSFLTGNNFLDMPLRQRWASRENYPKGTLLK